MPAHPKYALLRLMRQNQNNRRHKIKFGTNRI